LKRRAFTMVEIMVAVVILSAGLVVVYESLLKSLDAFQTFETRLTAQLVADGAVANIERQMRSPWRATAPTQQKGTTLADGRTFTWQTQVMLAQAAQELYQVSVSVSWPEGSRTRSVQRVTLLAAPRETAEGGT